ncbi:MAG TPA: glycosyltransferase family 9 protein [Candidatus Polarisedimenticolia bacterium]|nr:glycosyltransferase family 9 protein [Candidatus Polarisedimenticolia bacterium]
MPMPFNTDLRSGDGVLIVRLGAVGDVIRTLPSAAALRTAFPSVRLGWLVEPGSRSLLPAAPWLDEVFVFPRRRLSTRAMLSDPASFPDLLPDFLDSLRAFRPRLTLDFQGSLKSGLLTLFSGAPMRLGFDRRGSRECSFIFYNRRVAPSSPRLNRVYKNLELLQPLGIRPEKLVFPFAPANLSPGVFRFLDSLEGRSPIAIHPGTSRKQAHKRWPEANYAVLARYLAAEGCAPILTWGPGEEKIVEAIASGSHGAGIMAPPMDLPEMRNLLTRCRLFIGGDTGPMHLAWTHGVPVVALFGSTDPQINGPLGEARRILAPAWADGQPTPRRGDAESIRWITPDLVLAAARELLATPKIPLPEAGRP